MAFKMARLFRLPIEDIFLYDPELDEQGPEASSIGPATTFQFVLEPPCVVKCGCSGFIK